MVANSSLSVVCNDMDSGTQYGIVYRLPDTCSSILRTVFQLMELLELVEVQLMSQVLRGSLCL